MNRGGGEVTGGCIVIQKGCVYRRSLKILEKKQGKGR